MAIFEIQEDGFKEVPETTFATVNVNERGDLQRLLRDRIDIISPDTLVIAEEFGDWVDSKRRIDLLGIDKDANLVVIELKRTEDGGHMDLQAIRYAAMVSTMTFDQAVDAYEAYLAKTNSSLDARATILDHLGWNSDQDGEFGEIVRIVLASAEFSKELTTSVLWLNERDLDVRCVRIKPYRLGDKLLAEVQQVIPLPEAADYIIGIREKKELKRDFKKTDRDLTKYDVRLNSETHQNLSKRMAIFMVVNSLCQNGVSPDEMIDALPWRKSSMFRVLDGTLTKEQFISKANETDSHQAFDPTRYFVDELIYVGEKTYALTNQWGPRTFEIIQILIAAFPKVPIQCIKTS